MSEVAIRDLVAHAIGGGWGQDDPFANSTPVVVIRGADFPAVEVGDLGSAPKRYEELGKAERRYLQPGDLVLEVSGGTGDRPTGRSIFISGSLLAKSDVPVIPASFCRLVRPDATKVDSRYLYYWLRDMHSSDRAWGYQVRSTGIANFQFEHFLDTEQVRLPSLEEQRAIAGVLGALDDKIESNQRIAKTIRELLAVEFQQRFGAMSARTTLRQLVAPVNKAVQTGPFGTNLHASDYGDDGVPLVLVKHVLNGEIADVGLPLVVADKASELASYRLSKDDIVITRVGRVGDAALVRGTQDGWLFSGQMLRINLAEVPQIDPYWLVQWYQTSEFRDLISAYSVGSTRESLSTSILADAPMPLVEHPVQASFRDVAEPLHRRWAAAARESRNLSELRDALLPELLSGRLRVREAEKAVEGAV